MRNRGVWTLAFLLGAGLSLAHDGNPSRYNYKKHVRPIFVTHCSGCHQPGGAGPMSLLDYQSTVPWANAIKMQVLGEGMPPWLPVDGIGSFQHARALSPEEINVIVDWVVGLTPEGDPLTAAEQETSVGSGEWMGEPELVLAPSEDVVIGEDDYELSACIVLPTGLASPRTLSAVELRPGLPTIVRRATIGLGSSCEHAPPLATWLPGQGSIALAHALPARAELAIEILYVKGWNDEGKRLTDRSEVGLSFSEAISTLRSLRTLRIAELSYAFSEDVELVALYPDPGDTDGNVQVDAVTPDGIVHPILAIEHYVAQWREKYILDEPLRLPSGSELNLSQTAVWIEFRPLDRSPAE